MANEKQATIKVRIRMKNFLYSMNIENSSFIREEV